MDDKQPQNNEQEEDIEVEEETVDVAEINEAQEKEPEPSALEK